MKKIVYIFISILVVLLALISCDTPDRDSSEYFPFPDSPYDNVYEATFYSDNASWVMTSRTIPRINGNAIVITNYWWQEFDEEGNEEWLRYDNDFYQIAIPINKVSIKVIHIPDKNNTAHVVLFGKP